MSSSHQSWPASCTVSMASWPAKRRKLETRFCDSPRPWEVAFGFSGDAAGGAASASTAFGDAPSS
eukprot:13248288-Alexandrium_andersonii.AAC.1